MLIRITKGRDGPATLTCIRDNGTTTWTKVSDYFPIHDMTHYVVETTLKIPNAFYGLVRDGWDISDFAVKGASKRFPPQANLVEALVSRLQNDLMPGSSFTAASYNDEVVAVLEGIGNPERRPVTSDELDDMRHRLRDLMSRWKSLEPGESLELTFD
ncbi:MAG TPA: hypothetical protein VF042_06940 [Gemmatimonadaceae bacterium]